MENSNIMYKLRLNKIYVLYVQKIKNKNLLKLDVDIMYAWNAIKNQLKINNNISVHNVKKMIGLYY